MNNFCEILTSNEFHQRKIQRNIRVLHDIGTDRSMGSIIWFSPPGYNVVPPPYSCKRNDNHFLRTFVVMCNPTTKKKRKKKVE